MGLHCNIQLGAAWRKTTRHDSRRTTHGAERQLMGELAKKLADPAFVRCHREYIVNLNRVRVLTPRNSRDYNLQLYPPVN
jgi:DNA-binding LytR/AlgR family response regulator